MAMYRPENIGNESNLCMNTKRAHQARPRAQPQGETLAACEARSQQRRARCSCPGTGHWDCATWTPGAPAAGPSPRAQSALPGSPRCRNLYWLRNPGTCISEGFTVLLTEWMIHAGKDAKTRKFFSVTAPGSNVLHSRPVKCPRCLLLVFVSPNLHLVALEFNGGSPPPRFSMPRHTPEFAGFRLCGAVSWRGISCIQGLLLIICIGLCARLATFLEEVALHQLYFKDAAHYGDVRTMKASMRV